MYVSFCEVITEKGPFCLLYYVGYMNILRSSIQNRVKRLQQLYFKDLNLNYARPELCI